MLGSLSCRVRTRPRSYNEVGDHCSERNTRLTLSLGDNVISLAIRNRDVTNRSAISGTFPMRDQPVEWNLALPVANSTLVNHWNTRTITYDISVSANCCPIQIRGPPLNGMYAQGRGIQVSHRYGQNSSGGGKLGPVGGYISGVRSIGSYC